MSHGWDNIEPAPLEFMHGEMMRLFHEYRRSLTESTEVGINGSVFNSIVAKAKVATYNKYKKQNLDKAIPKSEM